MKLKTLLLTLLLTSGLIGTTYADFTNGVKAYEAKDYATALKKNRLLAEQGNSEAQYDLGVMYYNDYWVPENYKQAFNWYQKAAEQGEYKAQYNLGLMYYNGDGVLKRYD